MGRIKPASAERARQAHGAHFETQSAYMAKSQDMDPQAAFDHEANGARAGLNPMFGDWQKRFDFAPVSYVAGGAQRAAFRDAIQQALDNKFFYSNEVRLDIALHLDVQTVLETDVTADVDNYAKAVLDGLKSPHGILFDDTQVQALNVHWLDSYSRDKSYFTISISGSPDDFMLKPVEFYEMPDGLWYPHGRLMWSNGGQDAKEGPSKTLSYERRVDGGALVVVADCDHSAEVIDISALASDRTRRNEL